MSKIVYVTGCLGFIGSYVTRACLEKGWYVYGIDKCTYAADERYLKEFNQYPRFRFEKKDINDVERLVDCDYVINVAAESHVDNSIIDSEVFIDSNVKGVWHLLELVKAKQSFKMPTFLHFSTDEVYGDIVEGAHTETDILKPSNPYSASKAAADQIVFGHARTHRVPYIIVRPTNNYGIGQYVEKLIPKSVKHLTLNKRIDLHDEGKPHRTWLHVQDTANAVIHIIESGVKNEIYNISGNYETANIEVVKKIIANYNGETEIEPYLEKYNRVGQDVRYAIDDSKLKKLGWKCYADFDLELAKIVAYYTENFIW
jgi:dTDP-glucose 4,6-dehydratase